LFGAGIIPINLLNPFLSGFLFLLAIKKSGILCTFFSFSMAFFSNSFIIFVCVVSLFNVVILIVYIIFLSKFSVVLTVAVISLITF
jgi:hypothetical protein